MSELKPNNRFKSDPLMLGFFSGFVLCYSFVFKDVYCLFSVDRFKRALAALKGNYLIQKQHRFLTVL